MSKDIFSKKSRFSIRKLNIGVCSVLLGTLIMVGHTAQADETTSDGATVAATAVSVSQGEGVPTATSPITAPESVSTTTVAPAATDTVAATSVEPASSVASSVAVSSEAPASASITSSTPNSSEVSSTSPVVSEEATTSTSAKAATASEVSRSVTASTTSSTTASLENTNTNNITVLETANEPRVRSRRSIAQGETRSASTTATRTSDGAQNLDYSNKENVPDYIQISYEVDKANNVIHWTVLDNPGRKGNAASGYVYFTIPKDSVGAPTNWKVVQTDKNGKVVNTRDYWKDNDGSYLMGQKGKMNTYTGAEMTKRLTQLYKDTKNPAIKGNEAAIAAQTAERSQALYTLTADNNALRNVMWTITFDTPIVDKSK
uniref:YSIRK-type signal peptide-containing protein n=1 Tax=Streptococcus salivarius TaxID=1304 RepID=UPI00319D8D32